MCSSDLADWTLNSGWQNSPIEQELSDFLLPFGLDLKYAGINCFISNLSKFEITNPHVDILHRNKQLLPIKSRFNLMILGNSEDPMCWWNTLKYGDSKLEKKLFTYGSTFYESLAVPGDSIEERWQHLGTPTEIKTNLLAPSSFVNTNYAHALKLSAGPRLILSVPFDRYLDEYVN